MALSNFHKKPTGKYSTRTNNRVPFEGGGRAQQVGQTALASFGGRFHYNYQMPKYQKLKEYEHAINIDTTIGTGLEFVIRSLVSSLGDYQHPNPVIQAFVRDNLHRISGNFKQIIAEMLFSNMWAGFAVSEINWITTDGQVWLDNVINLHPGSVFFVVNNKGLLTENEKVDYPIHHGTYKSGIYQYQQREPYPVQLPLNKLIYTTHNKRYSNYYGTSAIERVWIPYIQKTLVYPSMVNAYQRFASPILYAIVPRAKSSRTVEDPSDGTRTRVRTLAEETEEALANLHDSNGIVLEDPGGVNTRPPELGTLTAQNNFGETYIEGIKHYDKQIYRGLLLPSQLIDDSVSAFSQTSLEVQFEQFKQHLNSLYSEVVEPFTEMCIGRLVYMNFGDSNPGIIPMRMRDPITVRLLTEMYTKMIQAGVVDLSQLKDMQNARDIIGNMPEMSIEELEKASDRAMMNQAAGSLEMKNQISNLQSELKQQRIVTRQQQVYSQTRVREVQVQSKIKELQLKYFSDKSTDEVDKLIGDS